MDVPNLDIGCLEHDIDPAVPDPLFKFDQEADLPTPGRGPVQAGSNQSGGVYTKCCCKTGEK